jgi:glyoxylase-like metal-dependent hydrolase (beta-lactamase superfamily II)
MKKEIEPIIHTLGHTPGHISLYLEDQRTIFGADLLWNMEESGLVIPPPHFTLDQVTAAVSVRRVSRLNFDKLLLAYQDTPLLENAQKAVEEAANYMIKG